MGKKQAIEELAEQYYATSNVSSRELIDEYLDNSTHLAGKSVDQYRSALRIFLAYINKFCDNKHVTEMKPLDFMKYQNWLVKQGLFSSAIRIKRSAVSNLNSHIILYHGEEFPTFRNYVTQAIKIPETGKKNEKIPITDEEYAKLCNYLEEKESWQKLAYVKFSYITGCRRNETRQLLKEVVTYSPIEKMVKVRDKDGIEAIVPMKKYRTNLITCKGKASNADRIRRLSFDEDTLFYLKKLLEVRGDDDCVYMFAIKNGKNISQVSESCFNEWCKEFSDFLGRRIHPHLFRSSRASSLALQGKNLEAIRDLLGHKSVETTKIYIVKDDEDGEDELFT